MIYSYQLQIPGFPIERRCPKKGCKDVFHAYMTKAVNLDNDTGIPIMEAESNIPKSVISFSNAIYSNDKNFNYYVHFYENDTAIERFWNKPWQYMTKLCQYNGFISPDYSSTPDMPKPQRIYNIYRNQLIGAWLQSLGYKVICNVRCPACDHNYSLSGVPQNALLAIGAVGCIKNKADRYRFEGGLIRLVDELSPTGLVVIGEDAYEVFAYPKQKGIPLYFYSGATCKRFKVLQDER